MLSSKLESGLKQSVHMTPKMQESIKILQLTTSDLQAFIEEKSLSNPFLEIENPQSTRDFSIINNTNRRTDVDYDLLQYDESLQDHLIKQINVVFKNDHDKAVASFITHNLNQHGFLEISLSEITLSTSCAIKQLQKLLEKLQTLDPIGCYAIDARDSLKIQLNALGVLDSVYEKLITNLDWLIKYPAPTLANKLAIDEVDLQNRLKIIKSLNPKPGMAFDNTSSITRVPEVIVSLNENGQLVANLNHQDLPKLLLNTTSHEELKAKSSNVDQQRFCKEKIQEAKFIQQAIEQRHFSMLKVVNAIITLQPNFFIKGHSHLKPMILQDISDITGLHSSTISRLSNKIIESPIGLVEIKAFFTSKILSSVTENIFSSVTIKKYIFDMIANEKTFILSDDSITEKLNSLGIKISRRTVTKYREALNIPSSHERKRFIKVA